jgi:spore germination cell wall hydrolase CwlJ-like protein
MSDQSAVDIVMAALTCWREARGEPFSAKVGQLWVMKNRAQRHWMHDSTVQDVAIRKWQFSAMTAPGDPNLVKWPGSADPSWIECLMVADQVLSGQIDDPTGGAVFYHDVSIQGPPPAWGTVVETIRLGKLIFYEQS